MILLLSQRIGINPHGAIVDSLEQNYTRFFSALGFTCVPVPNIPEVSAFDGVGSIAGIVLTGGNDVEETNDYIALRNAVESALMTTAMREHIPLLGICRGAQFIHHYFGGRLGDVEGHVHTRHGLVWEPGAPADVPVTQETVNSYHRRAILESTVPSSLRVLARAVPDRSIEAIAHREKPILGIMWHPEREETTQGGAWNRTLVRSFFMECRWEEGPDDD